MTEFETATLAFHNATLSLHEATLWVAVAHVLVAFLIGAGQIAAICWGIRVMRRMSDDRKLDAESRDRQTAEYAREARERHHEAMQQGRERHEQAMAALAELIRRTAAPGTA